MGVDILILNTAVVDVRVPDFELDNEFNSKMAGKGGLVKYDSKFMPDFSQEQLYSWAKKGYVVAGGAGNSAPLIARAGLKTAIAAVLGKGNYGRLDAQGRYFYDIMRANNVDMSAIAIHPEAFTGTAFIHENHNDERGGIVSFPGANNHFSFNIAMEAVKNLKPSIVYYMYLGLSEGGDANGGKDLANFLRVCRRKGILTIIDTHTLTGDPQKLIKYGKPVDEYRLLELVLPEVDIFFTSTDEARLIANTLDEISVTENNFAADFLNGLREKFPPSRSRTKVYGLTTSNGAFITVGGLRSISPILVQSGYTAGENVSLVGAGDAFRSGFLVYVARNLTGFKDGTMDFQEAIQMGNLFAALCIKSPLYNRYKNIGTYEQMLGIVQNRKKYKNFSEVLRALKTLQEKHRQQAF